MTGLIIFIAGTMFGGVVTTVVLALVTSDASYRSKGDYTNGKN